MMAMVGVSMHAAGVGSSNGNACLFSAGSCI